MKKSLNKFLFITQVENNHFVLCLFAAIIFGVTSSTPFFWENGHATAQLLGYGDYLSPFNSRDLVHSLFYTYDPNFEGGINQSFNQTFLFYYAFHYLSELVVNTPAIATTLILSVLLFISQAGFCIYILEKLSLTLCLKNSLFIISGSVLYGLSPYFISNTFPGHISALILFAFVPYLFLLLDRYLASNTYILSFRNAIVLIIVLLAAAPAFANIGNFIAMVIAMGIYAMGYFFTQSSQQFKVLMKFTIFVTLLVLLNSWWMLPFSAGLFEHIHLNKISNQIGGSVRYATQYATLNNIYSGLPEGLFHIPGLLKNQLYIQWYTWIGMFLIFTIIGGLFIKSTHNVRSWHMSLFLLILISAFITKGLNVPFEGVFGFLMDNLTIFNVFRRPGSKIYWAYWFALVAISTYFTVLIAGELRKRSNIQAKLVSLVFVLSAYVATILFIKTPLLMGVSPSKGYYQAATLLNSQPSARILAFPGTDAKPHTMIGQNDEYYGIDLFRNMLKPAVLIPDIFAAGGGANTAIVSHLNLLADNLSRSIDSCESFKQLGISYVVFRTDVLMNRLQKGQFRRALISSWANKDLQFIGRYGEVIIFKVQPNCVGGIFEQIKPLNKSKDNLSVIRLSPTTIQLMMKSDSDEVTIMQRENYSNSWVISVDNGSLFKNFIQRTTQMIYYIFAPEKSMSVNTSLVSIQHERCFDWANCWQIKSRSNKDLKKFEVRYILQDYFYFGLFITAFTVTLLLSAGIKISGRNMPLLPRIQAN